MADPPELPWRAVFDSLPERFEVLGALALALVGLLLKLFCLVGSLRREAPVEGDVLGGRAVRRSGLLEGVSGVLELARLDVLRGGCRPTGVDGGSCSD